MKRRSLHVSELCESFKSLSHTHILLVLRPFFTLLVGHDHPGPQCLKHRVSAVGLCC